ncbi:hypothetical protein [Roseovarius sp.]|jgi:hypothetical protein|uniref:hypothetical protein n=1 Tax=Roseovarius sp. TaxID=1486281 RepID=UPI0026196F92|nr:hypothetical protein [Roseovarius sp.]MDM8167026.1 hypothetical protein [Roseovarius sp.]
MTQDTRKPNQPGPDAAEGNGAAAATRLRDHIDRGGAADKAAASDPAAAPLGTDAEAAGTPPTREEVAVAEKAEAHRAPPADRKRGPAELQGARLRPGLLLALVAGAVAIIAVLIAFGGTS